MAILGLRDAAKAAGVSRQTIYRKSSIGALSIVTRDDGSKGVDTSELLRVFGKLGDSETDTQDRQGGSRDSDRDRALQGELDATREALRLAQEALASERARVTTLETQAAERERWLREQIDHQRLLLEHKPHQPPPAPTIDPEAIEGASKKKLRKLLKRLLGVGVALVFAQLPNEAQAIKTIGNPSCGNWVQERQADGAGALRVRSWLTGHMTGIASVMAGLDLAPDLLGQTDGESIVLWMDNYCHSHPLDDVTTGSAELARDLLRRQKEP